MKTFAAMLLGLMLASACCFGDDAPHFIFTIGHEYRYKVEYASLWRDATLRNLPNWEGELKLWPIERRADGTTLVRARLAMNAIEPPGFTRNRDDTVSWAEFTVGAEGVADYEFAPHADETPTIRLAFPLPPPLMFQWHALDGDETRDLSFAPGSSPTQNPWTITIEDHNPFLSSWHATRHTTCTFDPRAGRVLKLNTRTDFPEGPHIWTTTTATFKEETTLEQDDFARIQRDSAELAGAEGEFQALWREADDPRRERDVYERAVDASGKRLAALTTVIRSPDFHEDTAMISLNQPHAAKVRAEKTYAAREALLNKPSPDWTTSDLTGQPHALRDYRGKVLVLDFWWHDEPGFEASVPLLEKLAKDYGAQPVAVIGVNNFEGKSVALEAVSRMDLGTAQLLGSPILRAFHTWGPPTVLVIDADGVVRFERAGWDDTTDHALRGEIDHLLQAMQVK